LIVDYACLLLVILVVVAIVIVAVDVICVGFVVDVLLLLM